jgi:hypothetical protein
VLRSGLPEPQSPDVREFLKENTLDTMDGVLSLFRKNDTLLRSAKALFDRLFDESGKLDLFA